MTSTITNARAHTHAHTHTHTVLNPIDMRDRDLILIISFVMHFAGIEGHSFLWLEKFPVAFHSWLTIKIVHGNLSSFLRYLVALVLIRYHTESYHSICFATTNFFTIKIVFTIVMNPWTTILSSYASAISIFISFILWMHICSLCLHLTLFAKRDRFVNFPAIKTKELIFRTHDSSSGLEKNRSTSNRFVARDTYLVDGDWQWWWLVDDPVVLCVGALASVLSHVCVSSRSYVHHYSLHLSHRFDEHCFEQDLLSTLLVKD